MPNPGAFQGSRKDFLSSKKAAFARCVASGDTADLLGTIQRKYLKRYPIDLPHNEELSAEHLAAVDDDAADPEVEAPDEDKMTVEEYQAAMEKIAERRMLVNKRKAQIKRWFIYQYMKDHDGDPRDQHASSPYQIYLAKIRGTDPARPRLKTAVNIWRKFHREAINERAKLEAERDSIPKSLMASLRDKIARELFAALPAEECKEWKDTAAEEHNHAIAEWKEAQKRPVSTEPADRQRAIQSLVRFVQPVLDVIVDATGWKVSLFAGGPEPAQDGMLNVISVHSGATPGDIKLSFGQSECALIKKEFIPIFGGYLRKCYTPEECHAHGLSDMEGFVPISDMELEGGDAIIHPLEPVSATAAVSNSQPAVAMPPPTSNTNNEEDDDSMPELQEPDLDEDEEEDEDTPLPVVYHFPSDQPPSPGCSPVALPQSRQASVPPSPPPSPICGLPSVSTDLPSAVPEPLVTAPSVSAASSVPAVLTSTPSPAPSMVPASSISPASELIMLSSTPSSAPLVVSASVLALSTPLSTPSMPPAIPTLPSKASKKRKRDRSAPSSTATVVSTSIVASSTPSSAPSMPPAIPTPPLKASKKRKRDKENASQVACEMPGTTEDRRPRREVKKTEKVLFMEEGLARKGKQHSHRDVVEPCSSTVPASKGSRGASKKKGSSV